MSPISWRDKYFFLSFLRHDLKSSITVFFVALPLCLGISQASGAPVYTGLLAGIVGGLVIPLISKSQLSVSGPAAGLTAICATAITELGALEIFCLSVCIAGLLQVLLGVFKLGGFTHFIPSCVIKGMLAAIGIILIAKQIPLLIGYGSPGFWQREFLNALIFDGSFSERTSAGPIVISGISLVLLIAWKKVMSARVSFLPASFVVVLGGSLTAVLFQSFVPSLALTPTQFIEIPDDIFHHLKFPDPRALFTSIDVWEFAITICIVATLETLLSIEAIDKIDPQNRITPQNRELIAQGIGNFVSGVLGSIPVTSVIVRSSANAEAGAKTKVSAILHGVWLVLTVFFAVSLVRQIPYCVLAIILVRTGYNLVKPRMIRAIYKQGREQFLPFIVTIVAILITDLLIGVLIGMAYAIYFLIKHTYRAGFSVKEHREGHIRHFTIELALNVSFLNKKRFVELLERIPEYSVVEINGEDSVYIDDDVLEIFQDFRTKARNRHIELTTKGIREVETIGLH